MWFPTAAVSSYIKWTSVDAHSAQATISYAGITASAVFRFDNEGNVVNMIADRYHAVGKGFSLEKWGTPISGYGEFHGVRIPVSGAAVWYLPSGELSDIKVDIIDVDYNVSQPY